MNIISKKYFCENFSLLTDSLKPTSLLPPLPPYQPKTSKPDKSLLSLIPNLNKIAKVVLVFKKGSKLNCWNDHPISLVSNVEKMLEKLV